MLSDRQLELLKIIIEEHLESSEPIGSTHLVEKYNLRYSAATVRNEMAQMIKQGFLEMLHTSSGRVPTSLAYKYFLNELMEEDELPVLQEVAVKQRLWPHRFEFFKLLQQASLSLADVTKELAILTTNEGYITHSGSVNILDNKEFWDIDAARAALHLADCYELLDKVFKRALDQVDDVYCVIGSELGSDYLANSALIFVPYTTGNNSGYISVLGPARMPYANVLPAVKYMRGLLEEFGS